MSPQCYGLFVRNIESTDTKYCVSAQFTNYNYLVCFSFWCFWTRFLFVCDFYSIATCTIFLTDCLLQIETLSIRIRLGAGKTTLSGRDYAVHQQIHAINKFFQIGKPRVGAQNDSMLNSYPLDPVQYPSGRGEGGWLTQHLVTLTKAIQIWNLNRCQFIFLSPTYMACDATGPTQLFASVGVKMRLVKYKYLSILSSICFTIYRTNTT